MGCRWGAVRCSADGAPAFAGLCHCRNRQRATTTFRDTGDTGKAMLRQVCPASGSSLFDRAERMPGVPTVPTGSRDDASRVRPAMEVYCDSAQPWVDLGGAMQRFPKLPG